MHLPGGKSPLSHQHILTDLLELLLDLLPVLLGHLLLLLGALRLLLNGGDDPPAGAPGADHVLIGDGQEVPLLVGELRPRLGHALHRGGHVVIALGLLSQLGALDQLLLVVAHLALLQIRRTC